MQLIDKEWDASRCAELEQELVREMGAFLHDKEDNELMRGVAAAFGVARALRILPGVPMPDEFLKRYATTIGPMVFIPRAWSPKERLLVLLHELVHVRQFYDHPIDFPILYLTSAEALARYEAQAYRTGPEAHVLLGGSIDAYTPESVCAGLTQGYNLVGEAGEKARMLATDMSEVALTSLAYNVIRTPSVLLFKQLLERRGGPQWLLG